MVAVYALLALCALVVALVVVPRILLKRAQDRLASRVMQREGEAVKLLTRAELVTGPYRRVPGVLGLKEASLEFEGFFGDRVLIPTARIQKIVTGTRLATGRVLVRREVLRLTRSSGEEVEFVLPRPSASAWRSHLGLWAARERQQNVEQVSPGRGKARSPRPPEELPTTGEGPLRPR